jgi:hypothetical protein
MKEEKISGSWWWPQVDTGINAHDTSLRAHDSAFDHTTHAKFKCNILSTKLSPWPCALRVTESSCWKVDVAYFPLRLAFEMLQLSKARIKNTKAVGKWTYIENDFYANEFLNDDLESNIMKDSWRCSCKPATNEGLFDLLSKSMSGQTCITKWGQLFR